MTDHTVTEEVWSSADNLKRDDVILGRGCESAGSLFLVRRDQPAPKPEWDPGTSGTATVRTIPNVRVMRLDGVTQPWVSVTFFAPAGDVKGEGQNRHDDWQVADFVPDETRPLPTRDQVAEAVMTTDKATGNHGLYPDVATKAADAVLALLRGESR